MTPPPSKYVGLKFQKAFNDVSEINFDGCEDGVFVAAVPPFSIKWYYRRSSHKRLYVILHGGMDRSKVPLPVFPRWSWGRILPGHLLCISDPTLELSPTLGCGWYIGTKDHDVSAMVGKLVAAAAAHLGVPPHMVTYYGSSGGALSAIMCAHQTAHSTCMIMNAQIEVFSRGHRKQMAEIFEQARDEAKMLRENAARFSVLKAFGSADELPIITYAQNTEDPHWPNHFVRFCQKFGAAVDGGLSDNGRILTWLFEGKGGHSDMPPGVVQTTIKKHVDFVDSLYGEGVQEEREDATLQTT